MALVGRRGLIGIVDITLVDGRAVGQGACAALEVRLLDACGDIVEESLASAIHDPTQSEACEAMLLSENLTRTATAAYVAAIGHFDLLRPVARQA